MIGEQIGRQPGGLRIPKLRRSTNDVPGGSEGPTANAMSEDIRRLKQQGFTTSEATRLANLADRAAEPTRKRLQFTKWLYQKGLLNEFNVKPD